MGLNKIGLNKIPKDSCGLHTRASSSQGSQASSSQGYPSQASSSQGYPSQASSSQGYPYGLHHPLTHMNQKCINEYHNQMGPRSNLISMLLGTLDSEELTIKGSFSNQMIRRNHEMMEKANDIDLEIDFASKNAALRWVDKNRGELQHYFHVHHQSDLQRSTLPFIVLNEKNPDETNTIKKLSLTLTFTNGERLDDFTDWTDRIKLKKNLEPIIPEAPRDCFPGYDDCHTNTIRFNPKCIGTHVNPNIVWRLLVRYLVEGKSLPAYSDDINHYSECVKAAFKQREKSQAFNLYMIKTKLNEKIGSKDIDPKNLESAIDLLSKTQVILTQREIKEYIDDIKNLINAYKPEPIDSEKASAAIQQNPAMAEHVVSTHMTQAHFEMRPSYLALNPPPGHFHSLTACAPWNQMNESRIHYLKGPVRTNTSCLVPQCDAPDDDAMEEIIGDMVRFSGAMDEVYQSSADGTNRGFPHSPNECPQPKASPKAVPSPPPSSQAYPSQAGNPQNDPWGLHTRASSSQEDPYGLPHPLTHMNQECYNQMGPRSNSNMSPPFFGLANQFVLMSTPFFGPANQFGDPNMMRHIINTNRNLVAMYARAYERLDDSQLKKNPEIALVAIQQNPARAEHVDSSLWDDRDFVLGAVRINGWLLRKANSQLKKDPEIALAAIEQNPENRHVDPSLWDDRDFVLGAVRINGWLLRKVNSQLKKDPEIALVAIQQNPARAEHVDSSLWDDRDFVLGAVRINGWLLRKANSQLRKDREIVVTAIEQNRDAVRHASFELKNDLEIVLTAIEQNPDPAKHASSELKDICDPKVAARVLTAIKKNPYLAKLVPRRIWEENPDFFRKVLEENPEVVQHYSPELKDDRDFILKVVKICGRALRWASESLKNDLEIVSEAVYNYLDAVQFAGEKLLESSDFKSWILGCYSKEGRMYRNIFKHLKNKQIALDCLKSNREIWSDLIGEWIRPSPGNDQEFLKSAVVNDPSLLVDKVSQRFIDDSEFIKCVIANNPDCFNYIDNPDQSARDAFYSQLPTKGGEPTDDEFSDDGY